MRRHPRAGGWPCLWVPFTIQKCMTKAQVPIRLRESRLAIHHRGGLRVHYRQGKIHSRDIDHRAVDRSPSLGLDHILST